MTRALYPHQEGFLDYARKHRHLAGLMDMRLGKTISTIRTITVADPMRRDHILVVAPYSALPSWEKELKLEGELSVARAYGGRAEKLAALNQRTRWLLINREGFLHLPEIAGVSWDWIILDESHFIRNPRTKVSKFFCRRFERTGRRIILTGTPRPENDVDIVPQLMFLDGAVMGCRSYWSWRTRFCNPPMPGEHEWTIKPGARSVLTQYMARRCYIVKRADVRLDTIKVYETRPIQMDRTTLKMYRELEEKFEIANGNVSTMFASVRWLYMQMLSGGFLPNGSPVWDGKLAELEELVNGQLQTSIIVVWAQFRAEIQAISKKLKCPAIYGPVLPEMRTKILDAFDRGEHRVMVCQPDTMTYGADLSRADTAIYYSCGGSGLTRSQSEDRIISMKDRSPRLVVDLCTQDTVDEDLRDSLIHKLTDQEAAMAVLRKIRARLA